MRFDELTRIDEQPASPSPAQRTAVATDTAVLDMPDDTRNAGFAEAIVSKRGGFLRSNRRGFLKGGAAVAGAGAALSLATFGPAKTVGAQSEVTGPYGYRVRHSCPPYSANDNCLPGCGPPPICTPDCCETTGQFAGYFRDDPDNGYMLRPGSCEYAGVPADSWEWAYSGACGACQESILYRCHDGYVLQPDGTWVAMICRATIACDGNSVSQAGVRGWIDQAQVEGRRLFIRGWAVDPNSGRPLQVEVAANGVVVASGLADLKRGDVQSAIAGAGPKQGYQFWIDDLATGEYDIEVFAYDSNGARVFVNRVTVLMEYTNAEPFGYLDRVALGGGQLSVVGWVIDPDIGENTKVHVYVGGSFFASTTANRVRSDVAAAFPGYGDNVGFGVTGSVGGSGPYDVCVYAINEPPGTNPLIGCREVSQTVDPFGNVDRVTDVGGAARVQGWAIDPDASGAVNIQTWLNDADYVGGSIADRNRPDVGNAFPQYGPDHGFTVDLPLPPGSHELYVYAINRGAGVDTLLDVVPVTIA